MGLIKENNWKKILFYKNMLIVNQKIIIYKIKNLDLLI